MIGLNRMLRGVSCLMLMLLLAGCQIPDSLKKVATPGSSRNTSSSSPVAPPVESELKTEIDPAAQLQVLFEQAEAMFEMGRYEEARVTYQRVLFLDPSNEWALFRIEEINRWVGQIERQKATHEQALAKVAMEKQETLSLAEEEKHQIASELEKTREKEALFRKRSIVAKALLDASIALSEHDFDKARELTRKALMGFPDSRKANDLWGKIAELETEWLDIQKLREAVRQESLKPEASTSKDAMSLQQQSKLAEERVKSLEKKAKSDIEEIVYTRFSFEEVPKTLVSQMRAEFLEEQAAAVYRKAIEDFRKDLETGTLLNLQEKERQSYERGTAEAYLELGRYYQSLNKKKDAQALFQEMLQFFPDSEFTEAVFFVLGEIHLELGNDKEAWPFFTGIVDSIRTTPYIPEAYLHMAAIQRRRGNAKDALDIYRDATDSNEEDLDLKDRVEHLMADTLLEQGKLEQAYSAYGRLMEKGFGSVRLGEAKFKRALTLIAMERYEDARIALENILNGDPLDPMRPDATYMIGATYFEEGSYTRATVQYEKALQLFPDFMGRPEHLLRLAKAYTAVSVKSSAMMTYQTLLDVFPDAPENAEVHYRLAQLYYQDLLYEEAKQELLRLNTDFPGTPEANQGKFLLGDVYFAREKYTLAERQYRIATIHQPEGVEALVSQYKRAKCLAALGKDALLEKYFRDVLRQNLKKQESWQDLPSEVSQEMTKYIYKILFEYGNFLLEKERYTDAVLVLQQLVSEYPDGEDHSRAQYLIGEVYEKTNQKDKAMAQYQELVSSGGEAFWVEQAQFNLDSLDWNKNYRQRAIELGGSHLAERLQN